VTRTGPTTAALGVSYTVGGTATSGSDYTALSGTVTIPIGASTATISVAPIDDATIEADETVVVTVSANAAYSVGAPGNATVTIQSDDVPTVTIAATTATAKESPLTNGVFTVTRTGPTTAALTVSYSVGGSATSSADYTALAGTVTIPIGASTATITVAPVNDAAAEVDETVVLTLSANAAYVAGSPSVAVVTILSDEVAASATLTVAIGGSANGTVSSAPAGIDCGAVCSAAYPQGTVVTLTATPPAGATFKHWSGGCSGTTTTCNVTLSSSSSVTATFAKAFTDPTLTAETSSIKAAHVTDLRSAIDSLRLHRGLTAFAWTDAVITVESTTVKVVHFTDLRTALAAVYTAAGVPQPVYTDPSLVAEITVVKVAHVDEIRAAVRVVE
jgi:hypothetical protein